jgi:hypothetical protein
VISTSALADGFGSGRGRVKKALARGLAPLEMLGRHLAMSDDVEREIFSWIQTNAVKNKAMTPRDLREHITINYNLPAKRRWVNSFMSRHLEELCKRKVSCKKRRASRVLVAFWMKQFDASTSLSMVFRPNLSLIWMNWVFQNGKIGYQRL